MKQIKQETKVQKISKVMKVGISLCVIAIVAIIIYTSTKGFASGSPFSYDVGTTFVVDGYTFKIVDKATRYAVATNVLMVTDWGKGMDFARKIGIKSSYVQLSTLPSYADYNNATFRTNVGNLNTSFEWTSTPYASGSFWIANSEGVTTTFINGGTNLAASNSYRVRPVLYLKSGLYISGTTLYEPLPGTFGDLTIQ